MFVKRNPSRIRPVRVIRHAAVAALSLLIVGGLVAYATSPPGEAIAAKAFTQAAPVGREAIKGRVLLGGRPARGTVVRIIRRTRDRCAGRCKAVATVQVGRRGRFLIRVRPGRYIAVLRRPHATARVRVRVRPRQSIFIAATVERRGGRPVIAPVIFNY